MLELLVLVTSDIALILKDVQFFGILLVKRAVGSLAPQSTLSCLPSSLHPSMLSSPSLASLKVLNAVQLSMTTAKT